MFCFLKKCFKSKILTNFKKRAVVGELCMKYTHTESQKHISILGVFIALYSEMDMTSSLSSIYLRSITHCRN